MLAIRKILCPVDSSSLSDQALTVARHYAQRFAAQLCVLHIDAHGHEERPNDRVVNEALHRLQKALDLNQETMESASLRAVTRCGKPAVEIARFAHQENTDLIVMGTHGLTGWRYLILGSVAEEVMQTAPCPVLAICHTHGYTPFDIEHPRKILCPTDFSEPSYVGLEAAVDLAREFDAELLVMHAVSPLIEETPLFSEPEKTDDSRCEEASQSLAEAIEALVPSEVRACPIVTIGEAAECIVDLAQEENADLIVIATRGESGWRHVLFGSVSEAVARAAHCPLLTVPIPRVTEIAANGANRAQIGTDEAISAVAPNDAQTVEPPNRFGEATGQKTEVVVLTSAGSGLQQEAEVETQPIVPFV